MMRFVLQPTTRFEWKQQLPATLCPAILQSIQYTDKEWKIRDVDRFGETHVPTFAPSPIELKIQFYEKDETWRTL